MTPSPSPQQPDLHDLVIIGAGPTGLALAAELQRLGHSALVLDRLAAGLNTSRAAIVHARTLEVLAPLGVSPAMIAEGIRATHFDLRAGDKFLTSVDFSQLKTDYPYMLLLSQQRTEALLLDRLQALGGSVSRPSELLAFTEHPDHIELTYQSGADTRTARTRYLAACDGSKSTIREQAGIPFEGGTYDESFILGDVEMSWPLAQDVGTLFFSPEGLALIVPLPGNHFRIVATLADAPALPTTDDLQRILDSRCPVSPPARITRLLWSSRFRVHHRLAAHFRQGRILLAGDAAHVHSPAGGQGMNTGIQDAIDLAATLHQVLPRTDTEADPLLDAWAERRHRIARSVVEFTDRTTRLGISGNSALQAVRNAALGIAGHLPFAQHAMAQKLSELDNR